MDTRYAGRQLIELPSAASTNKTAAEMLRLSKLRHGAVILAHEQTAGVGQRGNLWSSQPGLDLTFSMVLLPPDFRADRQVLLTKAVALAVSDVVLGAVNGQVSIKWPNDVLVGRLKVAGILIQAEVVGERLRSAIVGIGLNVNSTGFPDELAATSLLVESGRTQDRRALLERFCQRVEVRLAESPGTLDAGYAERLWMRTRWAPFMLDGSPVSVRPMDVDHTGRLIVEHEDGRVLAHGSDRLRHLPR